MTGRPYSAQAVRGPLGPADSHIIRNAKGELFCTVSNISAGGMEFLMASINHSCDHEHCEDIDCELQPSYRNDEPERDESRD